MSNTTEIVHDRLQEAVRLLEALDGRVVERCSDETCEVCVSALSCAA